MSFGVKPHGKIEKLPCGGTEEIVPPGDNVERAGGIGKREEEQVAAVALYHDASEIITGDMPTPIKYYAPEIRDAYKKVEAVACGRLLAMLPDELRPDYDDVLDCADGEVLELVKAADKLSAYIKCVEELKAGNAEFRRAAEQTRAALDAMHLPELDYFMEHCAESFSMTLDELE